MGDWTMRCMCKLAPDASRVAEPCALHFGLAATARAEGRLKGLEEARNWLKTRSENVRGIAQGIRDEWTGPDIRSEEDRRANHADARDHDKTALILKQTAQAFGQEKGLRALKEPGNG